MKKLKHEIKVAFIENIKHQPQPQPLRKHDRHTGEILESFRSCVKFGFEVNAKNANEAREMILHEATKFFNGILEEN